MKQTINEYDFRRAFETLRPDNFSHEGLGLLYDWLCSYEEDSASEVELDVIAICCEFNESTNKEVNQDYELDNFDYEEVSHYLEKNTLYVGRTSDDTHVYAAF